MKLSTEEELLKWFHRLLEFVQGFHVEGNPHKVLNSCLIEFKS